VMNEQPSGWFAWALASAGFAALTAIFAKVGTRDVDPDLATLIRTLFIVVALGAYIWLTGKVLTVERVQPRTWLFLALSAFATGASWLCYFRALQIGAASQVAPVDKLSVVLVALFAFAFLGERPSLREWAGIALVGLGVTVIALP